MTQEENRGGAVRPAVVLVDPVTDWRQVVDAAAGMDHIVIAVQLPDVALPEKFRSFLPAKEALLDAGVAHALSMRRRDVFSVARRLQILAGERGLAIRGVVPLSEVAVEVSDLLASCLGLPHNPPRSLTARRDKGAMKDAVRSAGLRVAKYARIGHAEDLRDSVERLSLEYPVVVKTPSGMSTTDVFVCSNEGEAIDAVDVIVGGTGPDGRTVETALLEEYIGGTEFAINLMALHTDGGTRLLVSDVWRYAKTEKARYDSAEISNPADYPGLISYACDVARAVGIQRGAAHVELKARMGKDGGYDDPTMIEVGARLSGGRKSTMAQAAMDGWDPFVALIESHCGYASKEVSDGVSFLEPGRFVRHIFLPIERAGRIREVQFSPSVSDLDTMHSSAIIVNVGDVVEETTDIVSCAGFVWLVGDREQVDKDTEVVLSSFCLTLEDD